MTTTIKRKLYKRGSSFETTIPMPLLFALNKDSKYNVLFQFDEVNMRWYVDFEVAESLPGKSRSKKQKRGNSKRGNSKRGDIE